MDGHSASDLLRKASGCNFLVANPTNQLFTAFHRDVISYKPTACHASFVALKGRNNVRFALAQPDLISEHCQARTVVRMRRDLVSTSTEFSD